MSEDIKDLLKMLVIGFFIGMVVIMCFVTPGHCSVGKKSDTTCWLPEGCVTQYQDNPLTYKAGKLVDVSRVGKPDNEQTQGINLRIQSLGTYELFTENLLLCGFPIDKFKGKGDFILLTYETVSHRAVDGVACHTLIRVDNIEETSEVPGK
jgi:hypothetical protein